MATAPPSSPTPSPDLSPDLSPDQSRPQGPRRGSKILAYSAGGARAVAVAVASTVVVFGLLGYLVVNSPGWPLVQEAFLNGKYFAESLADQVDAVGLNVQLFLVSEGLILPLALVIAVMRGLPGPVFFPIRLMAIVYTDFFRAVPGVLVILTLGLGAPA